MDQATATPSDQPEPFRDEAEPGRDTAVALREERAAALEALARRADEHAVAARSPKTRAAYAGDWAHFQRWCDLAGRAACPAEASTVRLYLTDLEATRNEHGAVVYQPATLARRLAAVAAAHRDAGHPSPTRDPAVGAVLTGIKRARAAPAHRMRPLLLNDVRALLAGLEWGTWPGGLTAARDAVIVLAGFAGALRRSELAALTLGDLLWHPADGLHLRIRPSKTDQQHVGATVVLPYGVTPGTCPPCAALRWLQLLAAARHGRPALMRTVLATPSFTEQQHLYSHPEPRTVDDQDAETEVGEGSGECRAPVRTYPRRRRCCGRSARVAGCSKLR